MKKFRQWLNEEWKLERYKRKHGDSPERIMSSNWHQIGNHRVYISANDDGSRNFNLDYTVNGAHEAGQLDRDQRADAKTGKKILHHVGKKVDQFVRVMRPKSVSLESPRDKKIAVYKQVADRLAKKHNGRVETTTPPNSSMTRHTVHFEKRLKEIVEVTGIPDMLRFRQWLEESKTPNLKSLAKMSHKFIFHSGTSDLVPDMKHGLEPQHGNWIHDVALNAVDDPHELLRRSTPLLWMSDKPNWVNGKVAHKLRKDVNDVTDDDVRQHGHVAVIPRKGDHAEHIWHVGEKGLHHDGPYTKLKNLKGETRAAHSTGLYDDDKEPFGVEPNEYVSARPVEPMVHLTGQHLVDFLKHHKDRGS